jgi:hypothetical protein
MAELKTKRTKQSVKAFVDGIDDVQTRKDCRAVMKLMKEVTGAKPEMWGDSMVGYGSYKYKYASGRGGEWFKTGFSPRKQNLTLYIMPGYQDYPDLMKKLGKHKKGKSCLYLKRLDDVDPKVLKQLLTRAVKDLDTMFPS